MGGRDSRAARDLHELRRQDPHAVADLALESADLGGEVATASDLSERDALPGGVRKRRQQTLKTVEPHVAVQHAWRELESEFEIVAVPAQALLDSCALSNEVVAVVDEQPDLVLGS